MDERTSQSIAVAIVGTGMWNSDGTMLVFDRVLAQSQGACGFVGVECLLSARDSVHGDSGSDFLPTVFESDLAHLGIFIATDFWNAIHGCPHVLAFYTNIQCLLV